MSPLSPRQQALVKLYASIAIIAGPGIAAIFASNGFVKPALYITMFSAAVLIVYHAYQQSIGSQSSDKPSADEALAAAKQKECRYLIDGTCLRENPPAQPVNNTTPEKQ